MLAPDDTIELANRLIKANCIYPVSSSSQKLDDDQSLYSYYKPVLELVLVESVNERRTQSLRIKDLNNNMPKTKLSITPRAIQQLFRTGKAKSDAGVESPDRIREDFDDDSSSVASDSPNESIMRNALESNIECNCLHNYRILVRVQELVHKMQVPVKGISIRTRKHNFETYRDSFAGPDLVKWLTVELQLKNSEEAERIGQYLLDLGVIQNVEKVKKFVDQHPIYQFHPAAKLTDFSKPIELKITPQK